MVSTRERCCSPDLLGLDRCVISAALATAEGSDAFAGR